MSKRNEMDSFLKNIQKLSEGYYSSADEVYVQLCYYGLSSGERGRSCEELFGNFVNYYKNNPDIRAFVDPGWSYFCQFRSKTDDAITSVKPIKLYVPLKEEYLEKNVTKIMNFVVENDIVHCSKVAKKIRSDNLVLRVSTKEEADKIINFVNSNIDKNEMNAHNPFCISEGRVGLAIDGNCSYNSILSKYISEYIASCKKSKQIANINSFEQYMQTCLKRLDSPSSYNYERFKDDKYLSDEEFFVDLKEITNLILANVRGQNKEYLYHRYNKLNGMSSDKSYGQVKQEKKSSYNLEDMQKLLVELIQVTSEKYGKDYTKTLLFSFQSEKQSSSITRDNNLRNRVMLSKFPEYISTLSVSELSDAIEKYSYQRIPTVEPEYLKNTMVIKKSNSTDEELLVSVIKAMTAKYGVDDARAMINDFKRTNNPTYITRDNNLRTFVMSSPTFYGYMKGISEDELNGLIDRYANVSKKDNRIGNQLENICKSTYFSALEKGYDPKKQVAVGLIRMGYGDYSYITRANNARNQAKAIKPEEVAKMVRKSLEEKGFQIQDDRQIYLLYSDYIEYVCNNSDQRRNVSYR